MRLSVLVKSRHALPYSAMLGTDPRDRLEKTPLDEIRRWVKGLGPLTRIATIIGSGNVMVRGIGENGEGGWVPGLFLCW